MQTKKHSDLALPMTLFGTALLVIASVGLAQTAPVGAQLQPTGSIIPSERPSPTATELPSPTPTEIPSPTPTPKPTFTCCEHDIKVNQVQVDPQKTGQGAGTITVSIDYKLDIHWRCDDIPKQDCLAFYEITLEESNWQEFKNGKWVDIAAANVKESIIPDQPLKTKCDGKGHKGTWSYAYIATITTTNKIRNTSLVFDWDVPAMKGTSYHAKYEITGISPTTGTKPPTVKGEHPKKK